MTRYRVGTFNLEYGRKIGVVHDEIQIALRDNNLDALILQEAHDYYRDLLRIGKYDYYCGNDSSSHKQVGILVKETHHVTDVKLKQAGDGWTTVGGRRHGPLALPQVVLNGELGLKGIHLPTPSMWVQGKLHGPSERIDDLKSGMTQVVNYLGMEKTNLKGSSRLVNVYQDDELRERSDHELRVIVLDTLHGLTKIVAGDWNEKPSTHAQYSPGWVADQCDAVIRTTNQKSPHGNIDYFMVK